MTSTDQIRDAVDAGTERRHPGASAQPARFALVLDPLDDPVARAQAIAGALEPIGATIEPLSTLDPGVLVATFPDRAFAGPSGAAFAAAHRFQEAFDLEAAEPDLPTDLFPDDIDPDEFVDEDVEGFPAGCWAPAEETLPPAWAITAIMAPEAWAFSEANQRPARGTGTVVAQPDTGITAHAELAGIAVVPGFDVLDGDTDPTDPLDGTNPGHGTGTASVVVSGPAGTVTGCAPGASLMAIRAVESVYRITQVSVARAIDWAVDHGAHVITMSLGGIFSFTLQRALRRAVNADVIVLAAAGNCIGLVVWPARFDECIAVAGVDARDAKWRGSCSGAAVDISAPAENVWRATVPTGAGQGQGTSFAVALAAGTAALWLSHHGRANLIGAARARGETLQDMFRRMTGATARRPAGWDSSTMGAGIVDAHALLSATDFDLERDREHAAAPPVGARESAVLGVASLAAEEIGPSAALEDPPDWYRHGPELSWLLLQGRRDMRNDGILVPRTPRAQREPSRDIHDAVRNPTLRDAVGLGATDGSDGAEVEAATRAGAEEVDTEISREAAGGRR
jgi:serine protease